MSAQNAYNAYKQNSVTTASPGELTLMLYNGCLKFLTQSKKAIEVKNYEQKNMYIQKSQAIIAELMTTLNMDLDVSKNMMALYEYMYARLSEANMKMDVAIIEEVEGLVTEFRDTWKQVIQLNRKQQFVSGDSV
ncbi:flagellar export chaperone FliS [Kurthia gibsonii]|uniref:flagellar export chaperone FliS n=1 Tax=Kurthia gibsonii TaxID=33946 RepID=UPI002DBD39AA|nr:flagellar export chaperone FliS [Kurthia gibsonii]MEB7773291.1 flagellar export chaperone FliS [Kurthia gibsonii]